MTLRPAPREPGRREIAWVVGYSESGGGLLRNPG